MSTESAYQEQWPGEEITAESVLGTAVSSQVEALAKIRELQVGMLPALKAGSGAAGRDWDKICDVELSLKMKFEAETASGARLGEVGPQDGAAGDTDTALMESEDDEELPGLRCTVCSLIIPHAT